MSEPRESTSSFLERIKASRTPLLDALPEKEQVFVRVYYATDNQSKAATKAGYGRQNGNRLISKPRIKAALFELHQISKMHADPTSDEIISWLAFEATYPLNPATARISALKTLADIKGLTGGQGNTGSTALDDFLRGVGRAVTDGIFEGAHDVGHKLAAGAVEDDERGVVEAESRVVDTVGEPGNLAGALPVSVAARVLPLSADMEPSGDLPF